MDCRLQMQMSARRAERLALLRPWEASCLLQWEVSAWQLEESVVCADRLQASVRRRVLFVLTDVIDFISATVLS